MIIGGGGSTPPDSFNGGFMIYSRENYEQAKYLIGKKVICWSEYDRFKSNVYIAELMKIDETGFHFVIDRSTLILKTKKVDDCPYERNAANCFQFIKSYEIDEDKNYLLDFD